MEKKEVTKDIVSDLCQIIDSAQKSAYQAVNYTLVQRNWLIGRRIMEEELNGSERAEYGEQIIVRLAEELTLKYGKGFNKTNLYYFYMFYKEYPEIFHSPSGKSIRILSWTHYRVLLQVEDKKARAWYEQEALSQTWSVRALQRNVSSQYYYRVLQNQKADLMENERNMPMDQKVADRLELCFIRIKR